MEEGFLETLIAHYAGPSHLRAVDDPVNIAREVAPDLPPSTLLHSVESSVLEQYVVWPEFDDPEILHPPQDFPQRRLVFVQLVI